MGSRGAFVIITYRRGQAWQQSLDAGPETVSLNPSGTLELDCSSSPVLGQNSHVSVLLYYSGAAYGRGVISGKVAEVTPKGTDSGGLSLH